MAEIKQITTKTVVTYLSNAFTAVAEYINLVKKGVSFGGLGSVFQNSTDVKIGGLNDNLQSKQTVKTGGLD